jgi:hypothetical protein
LEERMITKIVLDSNSNSICRFEMGELPELPKVGQIVDDLVAKELKFSWVVDRIDWEYMPGVPISSGCVKIPIIYIKFCKTEKDAEDELDRDPSDGIPWGA